jgi:predicted nucleic-acid-binding protein
VALCERVLRQLVRARQVEVQSADEVAAALQDYASGDADFADALIYRSGRAAGCHQPATFDRRLLALPDTVEP